MSDSAFKSAPFAGYATAELRLRVERADNGTNPLDPVILSRIRAEITRREAVMAGDVSQMTAGERLRFTQTGKAR